MFRSLPAFFQAATLSSSGQPVTQVTLYYHSDLYDVAIRTIREVGCTVCQIFRCLSIADISVLFCQIPRPRSP